MPSILPKTVYTNIFEGSLPTMTINGHYDCYTKTDISETPAVGNNTISSI